MRSCVCVRERLQCGSGLTRAAPLADTDSWVWVGVTGLTDFDRLAVRNVLRGATWHCRCMPLVGTARRTCIDPRSPHLFVLSSATQHCRLRVGKCVEESKRTNADLTPSGTRQNVTGAAVSG